MAVFAITFRIHSDNGYSERYESLDEVIRAESPAAWWRDTTSFYLLKSDKTAQGLADHLYYNSKFDASKDILGVINLSAKGHGSHGTFTDADWENLLKAR